MTRQLGEAKVGQDSTGAPRNDGAPATPEPAKQSPTASVPSSASRRVWARLARRMTGQRGIAAVKPVLEPLATVHRELY
ncbi:hypothetical protein, partial [Nocardia sp. NPDC003672]